MYTHNVTNNLGDFNMIVKVTVNHGFVSVSRDPKTGQFVKIGTFNSVPVVKELINNNQSVMFEIKQSA
jgi:hypothetical protein